MNKIPSQNMKDLIGLEILTISYKEPFLKITGKNWEFISNTSWRIIKDREFFNGSIDTEISLIEKNILHNTVVKIDENTKTCDGNIALTLSNGMIIEFFKDSLKSEYLFNLNKSNQRE